LNATARSREASSRDRHRLPDTSDNGAGIPESIRPYLFEPGRSGRPGGSGLGLAISQLLARQIGANVSLVATGPDGTTFEVTLPQRA